MSRMKINRINQNLRYLLNPKDFQVGIPYRVLYDGDLKPAMLIYEADLTQPIVIDIKEATVQVVKKKIDIEIKKLKGKIRSSLARSVMDADAPEDLADKILSILAWRIDFQKLSKGDHYELIYEHASVDSISIGSRDVLAVHFNHDGQWYRGYAYDAGDGTAYYDAQGRNLSHAPLRFDLITSLFAQKRFHPVRRRYRAHYGMDFEAEEGTTVEAIADGEITRARYGRANGNNVKIKHSEDLTTQYLHLAAIDSAIKVGQQVKRGQKIGEVGTTGLSSGPHLCLRVWHKGRQQDPLIFDFPRRADVPDSLMTNFQEKVRQYQSELNSDRSEDLN